MNGYYEGLRFNETQQDDMTPRADSQENDVGYTV
jgi:hypothetical protein